MRYQIVYADPPWWRENGGGEIVRGAQRHYPLMKTADIMALPVKGLAEDNAHLYLWTTNNQLEDALQVVHAWDFRYVTMITWIKDRIGLGQYFRGTTEHCLFCVRGNLPYLVNHGKRAQFKTHFFEPKMEHSTKPETMRRIIERVSGVNRTKIELFARRQAPGWDVWGNEVDSSIAMGAYQ